MKNMLRVAILGPESTGKTELAKSLAEYFQVDWVPEFARAYVESLSRPYEYEDVCRIAAHQIDEELFYENHPNDGKKFVFFDTDLIITKVWFDYKYGKVPKFLQERLNCHFFDFYLLCYPDLPWQPDSVREHGDDREFFFNWYKQEIEKTGKSVSIITGIGNERLQNAIRALTSFVRYL